jgi:hypothetical protein
MLKSGTSFYPRIYYKKDVFKYKYIEKTVTCVQTGYASAPGSP